MSAPNGLLDVVRRASLGGAESGLRVISGVMEALQAGARAVAGQGAAPRLASPPVTGPADMDRATAEFANHMLRMVCYSSRDGRGVGAVLAAAAQTLRHSFGFVRWSDPRQLMTLPMQLPLSFGTLWTQESLRALYGLEMLGRHAPEFILELSEVFLDGPVYLALQYTEQLERFRERVRRTPQDGRAWFELGRYSMKCGMHEQAAEAFRTASGFESLRASALYQSSIARYRAARYAEAVSDAVAALQLDPDQPRAQFWLWLAAGKLGGYPESVPPALRIEMAAGRHETELRFESVASRIGLDKTSDGRGIAVFDYDGDGRLDVLIASTSGCSLFHNDGDGTFSDASVGSGLDACVNSFAVTVGDYDNDGRTDVFVTRAGFLEGGSVLYRNNGDGTFTDVTEQAGVSCWMSTFGASWVDYDCDGHLDLFVGSNLNGMFGRKVPDRLFHNNGDGTFADVTEQSGIRTPWPTLGSAWGDYNNDGYPDLFLSSSFGRSQLFRNNGDGTFTNVSREAGVSDELCFGSVAFWCDYDDDGWLDLVQCVWCRHEDMLYSLRHGKGPAGGRPVRVFHNNRDGTFREIARELGITESWGSMSGNAGDIDNDGHLDLLLGNGGPQMERAEPAIVLQNDGRRFRNVTFTAGLPPFGKSHGANLADLFGDGRLSILLGSGGFYPGEPMTTEVYRPVRRLGNYVSVRLRGTASNRDAIGARVRLTAGGRTQHRLVSGGSGFGCLPLDQHFGVGAAATIDAVEIDWPSRRRQRLEGVPVNASIQIVEGQQGFQVSKRS